MTITDLVGFYGVYDGGGDYLCIHPGGQAGRQEAATRDLMLRIGPTT